LLHYILQFINNKNRQMSYETMQLTSYKKTSP
jgi:hypothetical protein